MDISISVNTSVCRKVRPQGKRGYANSKLSEYQYIRIYCYTDSPIKRPSATPLYRLGSNVQAAHNPFYYYRRDFLLLYSNLTVLISISMFIPTSPTGIPFWKIDVHKEFLNPLKKFASNWLVIMKIIISCLMFE